MTTAAIASQVPGVEESRPSRGRVAMFVLITAEAAVFTIFVVAYLFYVGKSLNGPFPKEVLATPIAPTICLLASSLTIHLAAGGLRRGANRSFQSWWFATMALGVFFLIATGGEWRRRSEERRVGKEC